MLSPKTQLNLNNAKEYFREHLCVGDYYAQGQQVRGEWFGAGAASTTASSLRTTSRDVRRVDCDSRM